MPYITKKADEKKDSKVSFFEFKRRICQSLICGSQRSKRHSPSNNSANEEINVSEAENHEGRVTIASSLGSMNEAHMLVENLPWQSNDYVIQDIDCFLCRRMGKELKTSYSCIQCQKGLHVNCFTAFHYRGVLSTKLNALLDVVFDSDRRPTVGHPSKYAPTSTMHMKLPAEKETIFPRALVRKKSNVTANAKRKRDNAELRNKRRMEKNITDL